MPHRYEGIKKSMRERYPEESMAQVKTRAAKIYEASRKPGEQHIQTASRHEHRRKVKR